MGSHLNNYLIILMCSSARFGRLSFCNGLTLVNSLLPYILKYIYTKE